MKHHRVIPILVAVAALLIAPASLYGAYTPSDNPTAFVVDPCRAYDPSDDPTVDDDWPQTSELRMIDLSDDLLNEIDYAWDFLELQEQYVSTVFGGMTFASVPGYEQQRIFATLGSKLLVYDIMHRYWPLGEESDKKKDTRSLVLSQAVDIGDALDLPGLELGRISASHWYPMEVEPGVVFPQAALYIVGTRPSNNEAFYFVVDQESLITSDPANPVLQIYGYDQICNLGNCSVSAVLDIRVGDLYGQDYLDEAYITVVQEAIPTNHFQMTYRLERLISGSSFSLASVRASYFNAPDFGYDPPLVEEASGLRFAPDSHDAYVPSKHERKITNLVSGAKSCELPAEPTDVAVWQPASSGLRYLLVTTWDGLTGRLFVTPADSCVDPQNPVALDVSLGNRPVSLDLHTTGDDEALVLVVGEGYPEFQAVHLTYDGSIDPFAVLQDGISLATGDATATTCPSFVQFGLRDLVEVLGDPDPFPTTPGLKKEGIDRNCLPADLRCNIAPRP